MDAPRDAVVPRRLTSESTILMRFRTKVICQSGLAFQELVGKNKVWHCVKLALREVRTFLSRFAVFPTQIVYRPCWELGARSIWLFRPANEGFLTAIPSIPRRDDEHPSCGGG